LSPPENVRDRALSLRSDIVTGLAGDQRGPVRTA